MRLGGRALCLRLRPPWLRRRLLSVLLLRERLRQGAIPRLLPVLRRHARLRLLARRRAEQALEEALSRSRGGQSQEHRGNSEGQTQAFHAT